MGKEVDTSVMEEPAVFEGLVRRDVPGEKIRVLVEVGLEKVSRPIHAAVCGLVGNGYVVLLCCRAAVELNSVVDDG